MNELVSVIMSAYNEGEHELHDSIRSILNQSYGNLEIIIVNDNPNNLAIDSVVSQNADKRIVYIKNDKNIGLVSSLNKGLQYANGSYIARMDADDISAPSRIKTQLEFIKKGDYDLIGCAIEYIDENGKASGKCERYPTDNNSIVRKNRWKPCLAHPTYFARRMVYEKLSGYRNIEFCEDYDFICRCIAYGYKLGNTPEALLNYRIREAGISKRYYLDQKVRSYYIGSLGTKVLATSEDEILSYFASQEYKNEIAKYRNYLEGKKELESRNPCYLLSGIQKISNKYLLYAIRGKL